MPKAALSPRASALRAALFTYLRPRLAADAQLDLTPVLLALKRSKPLGEQRRVITDAIIAAVKPKLAQDADIDDIANLLDAIEDVVDQPAASIPEGMSERDDRDDLELRDIDDDGREELVRDDAPDPMIAKIREFLKNIGMSDEQLAQFDQLVSSEAEPEDVRDNPPPQDDKEDYSDMNRDARRQIGRDSDKMSPPAQRTAMDEATINQRIEERARSLAADAILAERNNQRAIQAALRDVHPVTGNLAIAFDSAEDVYGHAVRVLGHGERLKGVPAAAYKSLFEIARSVRQSAPVGNRLGAPRLAGDSAPNVRSINELAPGIGRVTIG